MTFCRIQEFYESPFRQIRNKKFKLLKFIKLYVKKRKEKVFTYPEDWIGFNIPGPVIAKLFEVGIDDFNDYDKVIQDIHSKILTKNKNSNYYLIAARSKDKQTIEHEVCHALYFLDDEYRHTVNKITDNICTSTRNKIYNRLAFLGYTPGVYRDELQAYLTTGANILSDIKFTKKEKHFLLDVETQLRLFFRKVKKHKKIKC